MNGPEHHAIVRLALQCLPDWAAEVWRPLEPALDETCMLPDEVAIPLLRGDGGPWRRHFPPRPPKFNFQQAGRRPRDFFPPVQFYLSRTVAALRRGDADKAARLAGVFSHYIGDFSQPAHHYELEIGTLLPPPPTMRNPEYHRMIEDIPATLTAIRHRPRPLGTSVGECRFRIEGRLAELYERSVAAVIPMLRAIYRRRNDLASKVLDPVVGASAKLFADFCCSAVAVARGRFSAADLRRLAVCDLRRVDPLAYDVEYNFGHRVLADAITAQQYGRAQPLRLVRRSGRREGSEVVKGICTIPHALPMKGVEMGAWVEYGLPRGTFARFEAEAGLLAGRQPQAVCRFEVRADGETLFATGPMTPTDLARPVRVDIAGRRRLRLAVRTDGSTDKLAMPIWARPCLHKEP